MSIEVGSTHEGKVTGITEFGAFIELTTGETGLVHISEIADTYVKDIKDHLKIDQVVNVRVINIEKNGKIGLSLKAYKKESEGPAKQVRKSPKPGGERTTGRPPQREVSQSFDDKLNIFLRDSEERLSNLKKSTDSKRGGRGAKRN
jgi:S1 RNA binding domain protein